MKIYSCQDVILLNPGKIHEPAKARYLSIFMGNSYTFSLFCVCMCVCVFIEALEKQAF